MNLVKHMSSNTTDRACLAYTQQSAFDKRQSLPRLSNLPKVSYTSTMKQIMGCYHLHIERTQTVRKNSSVGNDRPLSLVVVVVVFTLTDRASTTPSNIRGCQSGTWSQRGTKVNGSHHGDNPLLRPTRIQIATKSYATLQAMAPTNSNTVHQTSFTPYREQPQSTRIVVAYPRPAFPATNRTNTFQPVLINNSKFLKATHRTKRRKIEIPRSMVVEALSC